MRIDELDEFQGVTPRLVTDWLIANGWKQTKPGWWEHGEDGFLFDSETFDQMWFWTHALAAIYTAGNIQALLSKINPRMREWPSREAVASHNGPWVARRGASPAILCTLRQDGWMHTGHPTYAPWITKDDLSNAKEWRFWPCDEHGNKVKWPTDTQGNML